MRLKFYHIVSTRFKKYCGEIDIIAYKNNVLVVVEVKSKVDPEQLEIVSRKQVQRITNTAKLFMAQNKKFKNYELRFDLIIINNFWKIRHIKSAWLDEKI